ncbi:MAG: hypothetical protein HYS20_11415 [Rhodocyclales bacterium]|nr:hypothetical protein [Rhodocyclales bacterium]
MRVVVALLCLLQLGLATPVFAQAPSRVPDEAGTARTPFVRNLDGYQFPALAQTIARMQNIAHAMRLRDYCADRRVPDEFVRVQLERFSLITGRPESCASLLDY